MIIKSPQAEELTRFKLMGYRFHKKPSKLELKKTKRKKVKELKDKEESVLKLKEILIQAEEERAIERRILSKGW